MCLPLCKQDCLTMEDTFCLYETFDCVCLFDEMHMYWVARHRAGYEDSDLRKHGCRRLLAFSFVVGL